MTKKPVSDRWLRRREKIERQASAYGGAFRGLGHQQLASPKALKGSTFGPASDCRQLTEEERKAVEKDLRKKGVID